MAAPRSHNAPRRGEYRCPTCGGNHKYGSRRGRRCGRQLAYPRGRAPVAPRLVWGAGRDVRPPRPQVWNEPVRSQPPPQRALTPRERAKGRIASSRRGVDQAALAYVFDSGGFYESLGDRLLDRVPFRRRFFRGHWLCLRLNAVAGAADPGAYAKLLGKSTAEGLAALGAPPFMADVLGAGAGLGLKIVMGSTPVVQLSNSLRVLIPLVCPDLERCPAERDVVKVFATPLLADQLKVISGSCRCDDDSRG
jgi:hypothetical protein